MSLVASITDYLELRGAKFFPGWTRESLEDYVIFHLEQKTLSFVFANTQVQALIIGWQQTEPRQFRWTWQPTNPEGGYWWWDQYFAEDPVWAMAAAAVLVTNHPAADKLPAASIRHGKLKLYRPGQALKIFRKASQLYGLIC